MSWLIPCPNKFIDLPSIGIVKGHNHNCKNGPDNIRPDFHVCEVCGTVFQQEMHFEVPAA